LRHPNLSFGQGELSAALSAARTGNPLLTGAVLPTLLRLAVPNVLAMTMSVLVGIAETYYIGRLGTEPLAAMAVVFPLILGLAAALVFNQKFPLRGLARTVFILPMMATPVAVALVWTMMFHPQLGVLNWLLAQIGIPPSMWVYSPDTVIPTLVVVEVWHWTPLVMLLILGGLASLPGDPYEAAKIDGATPLQSFWHITLPLLAPYIVVALIIRTIDALKAFDTIYVITQGGPGSASETINIFLYLQAFAFYNVGYASAVVVVFFAIILALAALLMWTRQRVKQ
jgi:multiple sugar transport system permease protein